MNFRPPRKKVCEIFHDAPETRPRRARCPGGIGDFVLEGGGRRKNSKFKFQSPRKYQNSTLKPAIGSGWQSVQDADSMAANREGRSWAVCSKVITVRVWPSQR